MSRHGNIHIAERTDGTITAQRGRSALELCIHRSGYRDYVGIGDVLPLRRAIERYLRAKQAAARKERRAKSLAGAPEGEAPRG